MSGLSEYSQTLERLLATEFASTYAREALSEIAQRSRGDEYIDDDPNEELEALRDDFPTILRGSLFVYVVASFENQTRVYVNARLGRDLISKGDNLKKIAVALASELPGTIDTPATERLSQYKYLRDACAHTGGEVASVLHDLYKVSDAAKKIPGVVFRPYAEQSDELRASFSRTQMSVGTMEFTRDFIPNAVAFFTEQFSRIGIAASAR